MLKQQIKNKLIEIIKYDYQELKFPLVWLMRIRAAILNAQGKHLQAFDTLASTFVTGWAGSFKPICNYAKELYSDSEPSKKLRKKIHQEFIEGVQPLAISQKFFDDPSLLYEDEFIVLKPYKEGEKGVLLLKYSYYFPLLPKFFNLNDVAKRYFIVLEPSWAGFFDKGILIYSELDDDVFVMTYEDRDKQFLEALNTNIKPVDIGPSWWVDHRMFKPVEGVERDIDVIMVAAWAAYKRHREFFIALAKLRKQGIKYNVVLAGYGAELGYIQAQAEKIGVADQITYYTKIPPQEVAKLVNRSKVNVLWSRFEGNNRAIIEGMFCDTPCILRKGHNYGQHYDYINSKTGMFAAENELASALQHMVENYDKYSPREYVMNHRSCIKATEILSEAIKQTSLNMGLRWSEDLHVKVNALDGMTYFEDGEMEYFKDDYDYLTSCIKEEHRKT